MRILLAGRHELASRVLACAHSAGHDIVYVLPTSEKLGRGDKASEVARRLAIPTVLDLGKSALAHPVQIVRPDVILSCGYYRILCRRMLDCVALSANVHFGALPRYRGSWSIPWAIINGEDTIGVTLHKLAPGIDDGAIIAQRVFADDGATSCRDLYDAAVEIGAGLAADWLEALRAGRIPPAVAQDETAATYYGPIFPGRFRINWRQTILQVSRYVRAAHFPPYPSAQSVIDGATISFDWPIVARTGMVDSKPGTVVALGCDRAGIAVLNGVIEPGMIAINGESVPFGATVEARGWLGQRFE